MLIFGHLRIQAPRFVKIASAQEIAKVPAKDIVLFDFDFDLLDYCRQNGIACAVEVKNKKESIYANALDAGYLICNRLELAKSIQQIANEYLFDAKVIVQIDERLIDLAIDAGIDGVWLKEN